MAHCCQGGGDECKMALMNTCEKNLEFFLEKKANRISSTKDTSITSLRKMI